MKKGEGVEHKIEITSDVTIIYSLICSFIPQTFTDALLIAGTIIGSENTHSWQKQCNSYLDGWYIPASSIPQEADSESEMGMHEFC